MIIERNPTEMRAMEAYLRGDLAEGERIQDEFVAELREAVKTEDCCSCQEKGCKFHGKCVECVAIHRAHRHHLPYCFWDMVNERLATVCSLVEHKKHD